jgi:LPXTG-motif cell wall-anchored protein
MTLTLHYDANPVETVPTTTQLTVNYVDRNGQPIAPSTTQSGDQGTKFSIDVPTINGYRPVQINPQPVTGTYHGDQMTLTLHYDANPVETTPTTAQLTINYVDNNGQPISVPTTQSGEQGTGFSVTAPTIPGYQLADPQQQTVAGTYHGNDMTLTLTYNAQPTTPVVTEPDTATPPAVTPTDNGGTTSTVDTPSTSETPTVVQPTQPDQPTATVVSEPSTTTTQPTPKPADQTATTDDAAATVVADNQAGNRVAQPTASVNSIVNGQAAQQSTTTTRLPQTSETSSSWLTALGAGLLTLVSGLGAGIVVRRKRRGR